MKQCTVSDFNTLRELSIKTYYETFAHLNTPEDMAAYLEDAFNVERFSKELNDPNSVFSFLYCNEQIAGYLKQMCIRDRYMIGAKYMESFQKRIMAGGLG